MNAGFEVHVLFLSTYNSAVFRVRKQTRVSTVVHNALHGEGQSKHSGAHSNAKQTIDRVCLFVLKFIRNSPKFSDVILNLI